MKKLILVVGAVASLLLAGCNQGGANGQGGTSDQYNSNNAGAKSPNMGTNSEHNMGTNSAAHP